MKKISLMVIKEEDITDMVHINLINIDHIIEGRKITEINIIIRMAVRQVLINNA